jgi:hypothetical protein
LLKVIAFFSFFLVTLLSSAEAQAGILADRLASFPHWESKPLVASAKGDLIYPEWMAGNWTVESTLVDLAAPLAPDIVTPGFDSNRQYLNQPVRFKVRFQAVNAQLNTMSLVENLPASKSNLLTGGDKNHNKIVADRAFNGLNIGRAYLGDNGVLSVKVDPHNPNRQITLLKGDQQLVYIITNRGSEMPEKNEFIATEISQQIFQGESQIYLNEVETTTAYQFLESDNKILAYQVTAIYLSPQDPDYFAAIGRPVALYRYHLKLVK